jgi:hypothetical protein
VVNELRSFSNLVNSFEVQVLGHWPSFCMGILVHLDGVLLIHVRISQVVFIAANIFKVQTFQLIGDMLFFYIRTFTHA